MSLIITIIIGVILGVAFSPTIAAICRQHAITETFVLNLMAGWTLVGWRDSWLIALGKIAWKDLPDKYGTGIRNKKI